MKAFVVGYEYGPYMGDRFHVLTQDWGSAKELAVQYLKEEHLWDGVVIYARKIEKNNGLPETNNEKPQIIKQRFLRTHSRFST